MTLRLIGSPPKESPRTRDPLGSARPYDPLAALVASAIQRNQAAERTLLLAVGPAVLSVVRKALGVHHPEVDDLCQEACVGFLAALPSFRAECTVVHFACRVALLTALAARRRTDRQIRCAIDVDEEPLANDADALSPARSLESARRRHALRELVNELPLAQAEVLSLHIMLGHTIEETSVIIAAPMNTVRSRLRRALSALRDRLGTSAQLKDLLGGRHDPVG